MVSDIFGDSDYEYSITISSENLPKLYEINNVDAIVILPIVKYL
jgi:hypothetical protein